MTEQNKKTDTELIPGFKRGDKADADELLARYYDRILAAAENKLRGRRARVTGPDDVAVSVLESLWQRADENRFADNELNDSDELWRLLATMVSFKVADHLRREAAQKRGGGVLRGESALNQADETPQDIDNLAERGLTPLELVALQEEQTRLLNSLEADDLRLKPREAEALREIAVLRMEGYKVEEIARKFARSSRWVKRKLQIIRKVWERAIESRER